MMNGKLGGDGCSVGVGDVELVVGQDGFARGILEMDGIALLNRDETAHYFHF